MLWSFQNTLQFNFRFGYPIISDGFCFIHPLPGGSKRRRRRKSVVADLVHHLHATVSSQLHGTRFFRSAGHLAWFISFRSRTLSSPWRKPRHLRIESLIPSQKLFRLCLTRGSLFNTVINHLSQSINLSYLIGPIYLIHIHWITCNLSFDIFIIEIGSVRPGFQNASGFQNHRHGIP